MRDVIKISELKELLEKRKKGHEERLVKCYRKILLENTKEYKNLYNFILGEITSIENILEAIKDYENEEAE